MSTKRQTLLLVSLQHGIEDARMRYVMTVLQDEDTDPNMLLPSIGISPLHLAVGHESEKFSEQVVKLLLQFGANPNIRSVDGMTPIHVAAAWGRMRLVRLLLSCGGDPWLQDNDFKNAFHYAEEHHWKTREMLEKYQELDEFDPDQNPKYKMSLAKINLFTHDLVLQYQADRPFLASTACFLKSTATQTVATSSICSFPLNPIKKLTSSLQSHDSEIGEDDLKVATINKEKKCITDAGVQAVNPECGKFNAVLHDLKKNILLKKDSSSKRLAKWRNSKVFPTNVGETSNRSLIDELRERQAAGLKKHLNQMEVSTSKTKLVEDEVMVEVSPDEVRSHSLQLGIDNKSTAGLALVNKYSENRVFNEEECINDSATDNNERNHIVMSHKEAMNAGNESSDVNIVPCNNSDNVTPNLSVDQSAIPPLLCYDGSTELSPSLQTSAELLSSVKLNVANLPEHNSVPINMLPPYKYCQGSQTDFESERPLLDSSGDVEAFYSDLLSNSQISPSGAEDNSKNLSDTQTSKCLDLTYDSDDILPSGAVANLPDTQPSKCLDLISDSDNILPSGVVANLPDTQPSKCLYLTSDSDNILPSGAVANLPDTQPSKCLDLTSDSDNILPSGAVANLPDTQPSKCLDLTSDSDNILPSGAVTNLSDTQPSQCLDLTSDSEDILPSGAVTSLSDTQPSQCLDFTSDSDNILPSGAVTNLSDTQPSKCLDLTSDSDDIQVVWVGGTPVIPGHLNNTSNMSIMSPEYFSCGEGNDTNTIEITTRVEPMETHASLTEVSTEEDVNDLQTLGDKNIPRVNESSLLSETDSFVSASEDYIYTDEEEGVVLLERRYLVPQTSSNISDVGPSEESSPNESLSAYDTDALMEELKKQGYNPGPIIPSTKRVYLKKLQRTARNPNLSTTNRPAYSPELERTLRVENWRSDLQTYDKLEREVALQFSVADPSRRWREGLIKSSFCYLLLDPRITCNLPCRIDSTPPLKVWTSFLEAIFYVGKGKRSRPYSHLYEAVSIWKSNSTTADPKLQQILDIWRDGLGVVCLHIFQNVIPVEAYTREAAIIDALTLRNIRNARLSEYYGVAATWPAHLKNKLGVYLLHKAMCIFINEGERQLQPADIG